MNRLIRRLPKACIRNSLLLPRTPRHLHTSSVFQISSEKQWLWPLSDGASKYVEDYRCGVRVTVPCFSLETNKPVEPHHWNQAHMHVQRMCPILQVKIKKRDGQMWYYREDRFDGICKILPPGSDAVKAIIRKSLSWYGMEEVTCGNDFTVIPEAQNDPGAPSRRSATHPYRYTILPIVHHALADGVTNRDIAFLFLKTLSQVLDGRIVDDSVKYGAFVSDEEINELKRKLLANSDDTIELEERFRKPVILKGFPPPGGHNPTTKFIFKNVEADVMAIIENACKREGVTFHTALMAAHQTATMELLQASGVREDTATFCINMVTDMRRYMAKRTTPVHGLHIGLAKLYVECSTQEYGFWNFARNIERRKRKYLSENEILRQMVAQTKTVEANHPVYHSPPLKFDYAVSALKPRDLDPSFNLQLIGGTVCIFVHNTFNMSFIAYNICKGRYTFTFSYASNLLAEDTAVMLVEKTSQILQDKCLS